MVMSVNIHVPSSWQELTLDQLYVVSSVMDRNLDRPTMLFVLLCRLSGIRPVKKKKETVFSAPANNASTSRITSFWNSATRCRLSSMRYPMT